MTTDPGVSGRKKILKNFEILLDKFLPVWYNGKTFRLRKRRSQTKRPP